MLAGAVLVIAYGLSERLLPGLIELDRSRSAFGRLEQPLSYWNAMGALAALGLVLGLRLAGDSTRSVRVRRGGAAAAPVLGAGLLLAFSRGALIASAVGVLCLAAVAGDRAQVRALLAGLLVGGLAGAGAVLLPAVATLDGADGTRAAQGAAMLAWLLLLSAAAAFLAARPGAHDRPADARGASARVLGGIVAVLFGLFVLSAAVDGGSPPQDGATAARLTSTASNRYAYWEVALAAFAQAPVGGAGAGGFAVEWLRERRIDDSVRDAHSLPIETLAELGLLGLAALLLLTGGVAVAARAALARRRVTAAGPVAALAAWAVHASLDWDWEMPAVTLVAALLAGVVLAAAEPDGAPLVAGRTAAGPETARRPARIPVRLALGLAALAVGAALAVDLRADTLTQRAAALLLDGRSGTLERERDLLRRAAALTPNSRPDLIEAEALIAARRLGEAAGVLVPVTRAEPENARAWAQLSLALRASDPAGAAAARRRALELAPPPRAG